MADYMRLSHHLYYQESNIIVVQPVLILLAVDPSDNGIWISDQDHTLIDEVDIMRKKRKINNIIYFN